MKIKTVFWLVTRDIYVAFPFVITKYTSDSLVYFREEKFNNKIANRFYDFVEILFSWASVQCSRIFILQ